MRPVPCVAVFDLDEPGAVDWLGSLAAFVRANALDRSERRELLATLRQGDMWQCGGGAAPLIGVALHDR